MPTPVNWPKVIVIPPVVPQTKLIVWDVPTGKKVREFDSNHDGFPLLVSPDGNKLFDGLLWDVETG